jgi:hypothetical protein
MKSYKGQSPGLEPSPLFFGTTAVLEFVVKFLIKSRKARVKGRLYTW